MRADGTLTRSQQMGRIRGGNTEPEMILRRRLWRHGFRYLVNFVTPSGRADIAFPTKQVAVFVDGCFWHGCPDHYVRPRSGSTFWASKLATNTARDARQTVNLEAAGWRVCRIWEHEVFQNPNSAVQRVVAALASSHWHPELSYRVIEATPGEGGNDLESWVLREIRTGRKTRRLRRRTTTKWKRSALLSEPPATVPL